MASKCLVISTRTPGSESIIEDQESGYFINKSNALNIITAGLTQHEERGKITSQAHQASSAYSSPNIAIQYQSLYHPLINKAPV